MELLELLLILLAAILLSAVLEPLVPRVSLPLIQIAVGLVMAIVMPKMSTIELSPELFMVLFIAPLLYDETRNVDKLALWQNKRSILSLAIGLVIISVLAVGFMLHLIQPTISLAAAFALGAALGPTDAVAVSALGKDINLDQRQKALLSGEALLNDASGVVSFQFACAAAVTGAFSAANAGISFCITFFGGLALGIVAGALIRALKLALRTNGLESTTVYVLIEVLTPFLIYLLGERIGVSGIIATVAAGLLVNSTKSISDPASAQHHMVSSSVWHVLVFIINGMVFVLLGMQLPLVTSITWSGSSTDVLVLIGLVLLVCLASMVVRFAWLACTEKLHSMRVKSDPDASSTIILSKEGKTAGTGQAKTLKSALAMTLAGPKGAVSLSIILSLPYTLSTGELFAARSTLVFLASGVILVTLLLANFVLPLLLPKHTDSDEQALVSDCQVGILRNVINDLNSQRTKENSSATAIVVRQYRDRIRAARIGIADAESLRKLRLEVLRLQQQRVQEALINKEASEDACRQFSKRLKSFQRLSKHHISIGKQARKPWKSMVVAILPAPLQRLAALIGSDTVAIHDVKGFAILYIACENTALAYLTSEKQNPDLAMSHAASLLLADHSQALETFTAQVDQYDEETAFNATTGSFTSIEQSMRTEKKLNNAKVREVQARAYKTELEEIQAQREAGALNRKSASRLREEVYLLQMELFSGLS